MSKSDRDAEDVAPDPNAELLDALRALPAAERRLVMLAYSKARAGDAERKPYPFDSAGLADSLMLGGDKFDKQLEDLCRKLLKRPVLLRLPEGAWVLSSWLAAVEREPRSERYIFRLQPALRRPILELRKRSLIAPLDAYLRLEGKYSHRILEMLLEGRPVGAARGKTVGAARGKTRGAARDYWEIEVPIEAMREAFDLNERYKKAKALKKWVVMGAVTEINLAELGLRVEVETTLQGKKTKGFLFKVRQRAEKRGRVDDSA
ncbi:MAG TPA: replication initiation protein [Rectinemataceae bacterium]|nr:replication initiation protein [Rectinemataceae bacterium]